MRKTNSNLRVERYGLEERCGWNVKVYLEKERPLMMYAWALRRSRVNRVIATFSHIRFNKI